jgi:hypothetical protein
VRIIFRSPGISATSLSLKGAGRMRSPLVARTGDLQRRLALAEEHQLMAVEDGLRGLRLWLGSTDTTDV